MDILVAYIPTVFLMLAVIWGSSSLIVTGIKNLAHKIKISPFFVSFVLLGILTSATEITLAINSHISKIPEVSVGNLIGGIVVIFLFIIPILAIFGNGVGMGKDYSKIELLFTLIFVTIPVGLLIDKTLDLKDALIILGSYLMIMIFIYEKHKKVKKTLHAHTKSKTILNLKSNIEIIKVIAGMLTLLFASDKLIEILILSANALQISPFIVSMLTLSIGTNLPELALAIRAIKGGTKDIALGNYLGSAATNPVIISILTLSNGSIAINSNFINILFFTSIGLILFYLFIVSKNLLSRKEGFILIGIYLLFILFEILSN